MEKSQVGRENVVIKVFDILISFVGWGRADAELCGFVFKPHWFWVVSFRKTHFKTPQFYWIIHRKCLDMTENLLTGMLNHKSIKF